MVMSRSLAIVHPSPVSLNVVANDIAKVAASKGYKVGVFGHILRVDQVESDFNHAIVVSTFTPATSKPLMLLIRDLNIKGLRSIYYATADGVPLPTTLSDWLLREVPYIANSTYSKEIMKMVGANVIGVVPHGVDLSISNEAIKSREVVRKYILRQFGVSDENFVIFGTVSSSRPRKGLPAYSDVIREVVESNDKVGFYIFTENLAKHIFYGIPSVVVDDRFGKLFGPTARLEVMRLISAFDFYVQPSLCEGFGLPVLEALSVGVPVIHIDYNPLSEVTTSECSLRLPYAVVQSVPSNDGLMYTYHIYEPSGFVELLQYAYSLRTEDKDSYEKMRENAIKRASEFDIFKVYPKLLKMLTSSKS